MPGLYPVFLKLRDKPVLIVGGGMLALHKLATLAKSGARLTVVAPRMRPELLEEGARQGAVLHHRGFQPHDLHGQFLVYAATDDPGLNRKVYLLAEREGILANAVDDPGHCHFYTPSVVRRGGLSLAISTSGGFPGLARLLRETLEEWLPSGDTTLLERLIGLRGALMRNGTTLPARRAALGRLMDDFSREYLRPPLADSGEHALSIDEKKKLESSNLPEGKLAKPASPPSPWTQPFNTKPINTRSGKAEVNIRSNTE